MRVYDPEELVQILNDILLSERTLEDIYEPITSRANRAAPLMRNIVSNFEAELERANNDLDMDAAIAATKALKYLEPLMTLLHGIESET
jgi:hypothetical protein